MKVYVIYDTENEEHPEAHGAPGPFGSTHYMAAFTDSEKYAHKYIDCRRKKIFKLKKYNMSKKDFTKLCNSFALRKLQEFDLTTRVKGSHTSETEVKVVMTPSEYNVLSDDFATYKCNSLFFVSVDIFKNKYAKALLDLEYVSIASINTSVISNTEYPCDAPNASLDEVAVYIANHFDDFK